MHGVASLYVVYSVGFMYVCDCEKFQWKQNWIRSKKSQFMALEIVGSMTENQSLYYHETSPFVC